WQGKAPVFGGDDPAYAVRDRLRGVPNAEPRGRGGPTLAVGLVSPFLSSSPRWWRHEDQQQHTCISSGPERSPPAAEWEGQSVILRCASGGWTAQFAGTRVEMALGFGPGAPLYEVVEHLRWRWPNARIAFDEVVLEDRIA